MKRILIVLIVVTLGVFVATPATAKPECPGHPSCKDAPADDGPVGMTCVEADAALRNIDHVEPVWLPSGTPGPSGVDGDHAFRVVLNDRSSACVDVISGAGEWTIAVVTLGSATAVDVAVSDSVNPGDTCWGGCHGDVEATVTPEDCVGADGDSCTVLTPWLPASELDSCGIWLNDNGFADGDPRMAFTASYSGVKKLAESVVLEVTFPAVAEP